MKFIPSVLLLPPLPVAHTLGQYRTCRSTRGGRGWVERQGGGPAEAVLVGRRVGLGLGGGAAEPCHVPRATPRVRRQPPPSHTTHPNPQAPPYQVAERARRR
eukprot:2008704-Rhodomonas_salina.2